MTTLRVPSTALLPDNSMWSSRFLVKSTSNASKYTIARAKIGGGGWACSCPGWCNRRVCKHITELGLPPGQAPSNASFIVVPTNGPNEAIPFDKLLLMQDQRGPNDQSHTAPVAPPRPTTPKKKPPVKLAQTWNGKSDPTGWWWSEKLDGVRAWWNGTEFVSRGGIIYEAPASYRALLPRCVLDGELWIGRGQMARASGIARGGNADDWHREMKFMVFDAPEEKGPFEQRLMKLFTEVQLANCPWLKAVEQGKVESKDHLIKLLAQVEAAGGEGLVICRAGSDYPFDIRSPDLLKVLSVQTTEAVVIGYTKGKGNRAGVIGALECRLPNGVEFKVGTGLTYKELSNPPPIGTTITFGFKAYTEDGKPREPRYIRERDEDT